MTQDRITQLLETATDADKVELKILHNASISCLKAYNEEPTAAKKKDLDAARAGLDDAMARMWPVYFPDEESFDNAKEAIIWLKGQGYKIAKSKFYKDRGKKVKVQVDGSIYKRDLVLYAKTLKYLGDPAEGMTQAQLKKTKLETNKLEIQTKREELKYQQELGELISRSESDMGKAALISILEANFRNMFLTKAGDWIVAAGGDPAETARLIDVMGTDLDDLFNVLARLDEFVVET